MSEENSKNPEQPEAKKPEAKKPEAKPAPKVDPKKALEAWAKTTLEHVAAAANMTNELKDSKKPEEALMTLARAFDKLATRCSREAIIVSEQAGPRPLNPLVEITAINVAAALRGTARDLEHGKGLPKTYEETADVLKNQTKVVQAVQLLISQTGVSGTVVMPGAPLTDENGKPLVQD